MKKFTSITNTTVGQEPKQTENKQSSTYSLKSNINSMIDRHLKIGFYGPYTTEHFQQTSKIEGRELFIEALISLLKEKEIKEQIKVLESLKSEVRDWKMIDEKIDVLNSSLLGSNEISERLKIERKLKNLLNNEYPIKMAELQASKITEGKKAFSRYIVATTLNIDEVMESNKTNRDILTSNINAIADIFKLKAEQLGYKI